MIALAVLGNFLCNPARAPLTVMGDRHPVTVMWVFVDADGFRKGWRRHHLSDRTTGIGRRRALP